MAAGMVLASMLLGSCHGSSNITGLNLFITDAPIDLASSVNVSFNELEVSGPGVATQDIVLDPASNVDLYQLQSGITNTLTLGWQIPAGHYTSVGLRIASDPNTPQSNITLPDGTHTLYVPSNVPSLVTMPVNFDIAGNTTTSVTVDFDLRASIVPDPNDSTKYLLIPTMRAVQNQGVGNITGTVDASLIACTQPAVYVYVGKVTPEDVDIDTPGHHNPITTALVGFNQTSGFYGYTAAFLPPGLYTVSFTCDAPFDVANQANTLLFQATTQVTVTAENTVFANLQ